MKNPALIRILGVLVIIVGFLIKFIVGYRKFNRRSITGVERFKNYGQAWITTLLERIAKVLALLFILVGIFMFVSTYL